MVRILSFGGGVQTTAMVLKFPERYDFVVMADVGDEKPETIAYIERYMKPFFRKHNIRFVIVSKGISLYQYCINEKLIPTRNFRWCTEKFKISPIRKWVRTELKATKNNPVYQDIGFSYDEYWRADGGKHDPKYLISEYPLVDNKITREECFKIILDAGFPVPPKSGCFYCPFAKKKEWQELKVKYPELWENAVTLEKNNARYPEMLLKNKKLDDLVFDHSLDDFDESCDSGYCFV